MVHTVCANYCLRYVHSIRSVHVDSSTYSTDLCRIDDLTCLCETFSRIHYLLDCVAFDSLSIESCKTILSKRMGCPLSHAVCVCCVSRRNYSDQLNLSGCSMNFLTCTRFSFFFWSVIEHFTSPEEDFQNHFFPLQCLCAVFCSSFRTLVAISLHTKSSLTTFAILPFCLLVSVIYTRARAYALMRCDMQTHTQVGHRTYQVLTYLSGPGFIVTWLSLRLATHTS